MVKRNTKAEIKRLVRALEGRNVHLEYKDGDTFNGMLRQTPDGVTVGNHFIELDNVRRVIET